MFGEDKELLNYMNNKLYKALKLCCAMNGSNVESWKKAYKNMPSEVKKKFHKDILEEAEKIRLDKRTTLAP